MTVVKNYMIRDGLWNSQGLTATEKMVALCLVQYRNENTNECVVAQRLIARKTELSLRAVAKALASLESKMLVARSQSRDDFCQYDFWLPAFYVNSVHVVHTPPRKKPIKFAPDEGCIPAWEAEKLPLTDYPPEEVISKNEFDELVRLTRSMDRPERVEPWPLNFDVLRWPCRGDSTSEPEDLPSEEWKKHSTMAGMLLRMDSAKKIMKFGSGK